MVGLMTEQHNKSSVSLAPLSLSMHWSLFAQITSTQHFIKSLRFNSETTNIILFPQTPWEYSAIPTW